MNLIIIKSQSMKKYKIYYKNNKENRIFNQNKKLLIITLIVYMNSCLVSSKIKKLLIVFIIKRKILINQLFLKQKFKNNLKLIIQYFC